MVDQTTPEREMLNLDNLCKGKLLLQIYNFFSLSQNVRNHYYPLLSGNLHELKALAGTEVSCMSRVHMTSFQMHLRSQGFWRLHNYNYNIIVAAVATSWDRK